MTSQNPDRPALPSRFAPLIAFSLFILISGGSSVAIRLTYLELAPFWVAASRFTLAAVFFWIVVLLKHIPLPRGRALGGALLFGLLTVGLAFLLISWGLVATPASLYQILMAVVPLLTLFLSALHGLEAISNRGVLGSLLAVGGIIVTVGGAPAVDLSLPHIAAILVAAALLAEGGVLVKKFPPNPPIVTSAIGLTIGAVVLGIASLASGERWTLPREPGTWAAFLYLVLFVTTTGFLLYLFVLSRWSASGASYGFVLLPLVTMGVASTLAGEAMTLNVLMGAVLVLAGVWVGALLPSRTKPAAVEECKDRSGQVLPRCM